MHPEVDWAVRQYCIVALEAVLKFETSENLIDLLVGQNLYSSQDVAMRELLQNAEDACHLQTLVDSIHSPEIVVRYSVKENWVEIIDNGLGMELDVFKESFATIGASKSNSPKLQALLDKVGAGNRPIGQFGIGILSCFGVADIVEVRTRAENAEPISVRIADRRKPFEELNDHRITRGTTLRLNLKPSGPMQASQVPSAVSRYVRHARHISIENADSGSHNVVQEQWLLENWDQSSAISSSVVEAGYLQLSDAWDNINQGFDAQIVLCNAGFLVSNDGAGTLPDYAIGIRGEINVKPGALTILMNREGFQQDISWKVFVSDLVSHYQRCIARKLDNWLSSALEDLPIEMLRAIQRGVFLILRSGLKEIVGEANVEKAQQLVPKVLLLAEGRTDAFARLAAIARKQPPLYVHRTDDQQQVQKSFTDRGQSVNLTETVRSSDLRISLLKLNGFAVAQVEKHSYVLNFGKKSQAVNIHDFDVLCEFCSINGIKVSKVQDAPSEHTRIGFSPDAEAITGLLQISSDLKIQSVDGITDAIIADFNGYILNSGNNEIRNILNIIPDAVGNPIRKDLLSAYFLLSTYNISKARETILRLITDPQFEIKARRKTGRFFRSFLRERVAALLGRRLISPASR